MLAETCDRLRAGGVPGAELEARRIVERATGAGGAELDTVLAKPATVRGVAHLDTMVERRTGGEPLQYVLGEWGFRSLDLFIDHRVLIPRPETEQVVEAAIRALAGVDAAIDAVAPDRTAPRVVDLGTGSGAMALSIAVEVPTAQVWATDVSADALAVARGNTAGIGRSAARVSLSEGHWFDALPGELRGTLDLVVSNPPYIGETEPLDPSVTDWEPSMALIGGPEGHEMLLDLVAESTRWLAPSGLLVLEMAPHQVPLVGDAAAGAGLNLVETIVDLAGHHRGIVAQLPPLAKQ